MLDNSKIVCITASYPYGSRETYFENELMYLAASFEEVYILPIYIKDDDRIKRDVPNNVTVLPVLMPYSNKGRFLALLRNFKIIDILWKEFFLERVFLNKSKAKNWLNTYIKYCLSVGYFKNLNLDKNCLIYSYWASFEGLHNHYFSKYKKVIRMHGGDFYTNRNNGYLPIRRQLYKKSHLLLPISNNIKQILKDKYSIKDDHIHLSYLGVDNSFNPNFSTNSEYFFVSCSNLYALKRVHKIYDILKALPNNLKITWHHYGDGDRKDFIFDYIKSKKSDNITVEFFGHVDQATLKLRYTEYNYSWFLNVSQYEGLPVSIMEAFSFGIPAIATNVGGTAEIVNEKNGILIDLDFNETMVAKKILDICLNKPRYEEMRYQAFSTWDDMFNASKNYNLLIAKLKSL